ncbi:MAG: threonine/serine exporter family protein [[Clostridium] fimetarium]|nr:threonine/serine exporter family protein [Alistipes timonensis]MCM1405064.1 threonine/serine exporter family protein [[Clostridium] fimetarium]
MMTDDGVVTASCGCREAAVDYSLREVGEFLSEYSAWLLGCGATCIRLEKNVRRMAEALGCGVVMTILPRHVHLTVCLSDRSDSYTCIANTVEVPISFDINTRLSRLSWELADGRIDFEGARRSFREIIRTRPEDKRVVLLLASLANGAFCRLFGGDWQSVAVVVLATMAGFYLRQLLCGRKMDLRLVFIICAFVSSVIGASASLFSLGSTPEIAVGTSVLYLVPGIPFLNSFSDMLDGHYICAFSRMTHAVVLTCCLSLGLCGGLLLMGIGMF